MEFRILGPLEVSRDGQPVTVTGRNHPKLLAVLLLEAGRVVSGTRLVEALWEYDPPATARRQVQNTLASLRRQLAGPGAPAIEATGEGYRIVVSTEAVDAQCFAELARQGQDAHKREDLAAASRLFAEALDLWRGEALAGLSGRVVEAAVLRLNESRLATLEDRCEVDIALGRHGLVIGELRELLEHHPYRQRVAGLLMTALHHNGRTPEALEVFTDLRARLSAELGLDPDAELARLHGNILRGDLTAPPPTDARPVAPHPAQLPAGTATFTGRRQHLTTLDKLLDGGRTAAVVSAISGLGGAGKTALAVHWAHQVRDRFADGQLYVNLRGYDAGPPVAPADALARFLNALGQPGSAIPADVDEAGAMYRSLLADRSMLIMLDNARDAAQVRPLLPGGAGNFALVTSRDRLTSLAALDDAAPIRLDTLEHLESIQLLGQLLGTARVRAESEAADRLARLCGHLPLALRIAAANLAERPEVTIARFASELEGPDRLDQLAVPDDPNVAVSRTLDLSYRTLPSDTRRLLAALGLLPGEDFTEDLARHLAESSDDGGHEAVAGLESAHLIERTHDDRLRLHDLVRDYARQQAATKFDSTAEEAIKARVIDWHHVNHRTLTVDEYPNITSAFTRWRTHPEAWRLAVNLGRFTDYNHDLAETTKLLSECLDLAYQRDDHVARRELLATLAIVHRESGDHAKSFDCARHAVAVNDAHDLDDPAGRHVGNLGVLYIDQGKYREALPLLQRALQFARDADHLPFAVIRSSALGSVHRAMGGFTEAEEHLRWAVEHSSRPPADFHHVGSRYLLAELYVDMGRFTEAAPLIELVLSDSSNPVRYRILALIRRAEIRRLSGQCAPARADLFSALDLAGESMRLWQRRIVEAAFAELDIATGQDQQAADRLLMSHPPGDEQVGRFERAQSDRLLCLALARLGNGNRAMPYGEAALEAFRAMPHPLSEARTQTAIAAAHDASGDTAAADHCRADATAILLRIGVPGAPVDS